MKEPLLKVLPAHVLPVQVLLPQVLVVQALLLLQALHRLAFWKHPHLHGYHLSKP